MAHDCSHDINEITNWIEKRIRQELDSLHRIIDICQRGIRSTIDHWRMQQHYLLRLLHHHWHTVQWPPKRHHHSEDQRSNGKERQGNTCILILSTWLGDAFLSSFVPNQWKIRLLRTGWKDAKIWMSEKDEVIERMGITSPLFCST